MLIAVAYFVQNILNEVNFIFVHHCNFVLKILIMPQKKLMHQLYKNKKHRLTCLMVLKLIEFYFTIVKCEIKIKSVA